MFKKYVANAVVIALILLFSVVLVNAHSGRTDKYGGHHDRKNGGYHFHNSGTVRRQSVTRPNTNKNKVQTGRVYVRGYYRKDGTYVRPHYRTAPDGNPYNNYSFPGNYNPNTGKITTGDPQKYLDRYYNKTGNSAPPTNVGKPLTPIPKPNPPVRQDTFGQDTSIPTAPTDSNVTNSLNSQEIKKYLRNSNRQDEISDETTIVIGFIAIIGFVIFVCYSLIHRET